VEFISGLRNLIQIFSISAESLNAVLNYIFLVYQNTLFNKAKMLLGEQNSLYDDKDRTLQIRCYFRELGAIYVGLFLGL
jgi:hypothetical protein